MTPTIPLPTDNIHKFVCLFGLAVIELQANAPPTEVDADRLKLAKAMLSVTTQNRQAGTWGIAATLSIGLVSCHG
ncbi:hypothetical protein [uncultured Sphaerotilus sp.]|uniref:hypothetical protein n=1 Tax=uncultured Sphaerotilus sp. TaxID=474984 RepID=UPI0030CA13CF